jgi:glycosyltransferase involved in cell wall biosynthesis
MTAGVLGATVSGDAGDHAATVAPHTTAACGGPRPRMLLVVNVDWFFWSHRLSLARAFRDAGYEVIVATGTEDEDFSTRIAAEGLRYEHLQMARGWTSVRRETATFVELVRLYRRLRPDLVHHVTVKPVVYGSLAARVAGVPWIVNAISGLGWTFLGQGPAGRLRHVAGVLAYRCALAGARVRVIFQNPDDLELFVARGIVARERTALIRGLGVDPSRFRPTPEPTGTPVVLFASRLLWDKGLAELVEAIRMLRAAGHACRLVVAGRVDRWNPRAVPAATLQAWHAAGLCDWRGLVTDMPALLQEASIVALPSYGEGLPRILIEAASAGRPIVSTDVPGCREIARHEENALLVPARDAGGLARALARLLHDPALRHRLGRRGRVLAATEFSEQRTIGEMLALLGALAPPPCARRARAATAG